MSLKIITLIIMVLLKKVERRRRRIVLYGWSGFLAEKELFVIILKGN
jgi:hypothetical protein